MLVLSVLALSSRFDGRVRFLRFTVNFELSVLALSSRFDGLSKDRRSNIRENLSVLALSSRFDGRIYMIASTAILMSFSTRSVESF